MITTLRKEPDQRSPRKYGVEYSRASVDLVADPRRDRLAQELREAARSINTRIAYAKAWCRFTEYAAPARSSRRRRAPTTLRSFSSTLVLNQQSRPGGLSPWAR